MCLALPIKIKKIDKDGNVFVNFSGKKIRVSDVMVKVKKGDYVYLRDKLILAKVSEQEVEKTKNLFFEK